MEADTAQYKLALGYAKSKRLDEALPILRKLAERPIDSKVSSAALGMLTIIDSPRRAYSAAWQLVRRMPENPTNWASLARCARRCGFVRVERMALQAECERQPKPRASPPK